MKRTLTLATLTLMAACTTPPDRDGGMTGDPQPMPTIPTGVGSSSSPGQTFMGNEITADLALSTVDLGEFKATMFLPLLHMFQERHPGWPADHPISTLRYSPAKADGKWLDTELGFSGGPTTVRLGVDGFIVFRQWRGDGEEWISIGGTATILPDGGALG
jgi:hypothetical protein